MKIAFDIPDGRITDLLHGHGGSVSSWLHVVKGNWNEQGAAFVKFDREEDEEGSGNGNLSVTPARVHTGLEIMARDFPQSFADFVKQDDDDLTFDVAWQCIIFGKLIYG